MKILAVVIPYYKRTFFRETLESLASQTDQRFTVYIGDDASSENPEELLKEFEGKFNFVYKKFEENLGRISLTKQWDRCIEMMQGEEWFMILGDDDYLGKNVVEEYYRNLEIAEIKIISVIKMNSAIVNEKGTVLLEKKPEPLIKSSVEHFFDKFIHEGRSSLSEHIFRKSQYEKYGFADFPVAWHSDDLALLELSEFGKILFLKEAKCFVRISPESITGQQNANVKEKTHATKLFFERISGNLDKFKPNEKRKLFDIIQWYEKSKEINIKIPYKVFEYYQCYGFIKTLKLFLS